MIPSLSAPELQQIPKSFDGPDRVFEIKFDGFRSLAKVGGSECVPPSPPLCRR
jgi:hypothetical protein